MACSAPGTCDAEPAARVPRPAWPAPERVDRPDPLARVRSHRPDRAPRRCDPVSPDREARERVDQEPAGRVAYAPEPAARADLEALVVPAVSVAQARVAPGSRAAPTSSPPG